MQRVLDAPLRVPQLPARKCTWAMNPKFSWRGAQRRSNPAALRGSRKGGGKVTGLPRPSSRSRRRPRNNESINYGTVHCEFPASARDFTLAIHQLTPWLHGERGVCSWDVVSAREPHRRAGPLFAGVRAQIVLYTGVNQQIMLRCGAVRCAPYVLRVLMTDSGACSVARLIVRRSISC